MNNTVSIMGFLCDCIVVVVMCLILRRKLFPELATIFDTISYPSSDPTNLSNFFTGLYCCGFYAHDLGNNRICNDLSMHVIGSVLNA